MTHIDPQQCMHARLGASVAGRSPSTYYCVLDRGHDGEHAYREDPDETPERIEAAIRKIWSRDERMEL